MFRLAKLLIATCMAIASALVVCYSFSQAWINSGDSGVISAIELATSFKATYGNYPDDVPVSANNVWRLFSGPKIHYSANLEECEAYYYQ